MATIQLNAENLNATIDNHSIVLMDFWAEWCGPCRMFGPIFEKAAEKNPDITFAKCNTEEAQDVAASFGVSSIPTLAVFRDQILVYKQAGALPAPALDDLIKQVRALDMDQVRKEIAAKGK